MQSNCMGASKTTTFRNTNKLEEVRDSFIKSKAAFLAFLATDAGKQFIAGDESLEECFNKYMNRLADLAEIASALEVGGEM